MIRLIKGKFISDGRMYAAGDVLPDTPGARALAEMGRAVIETEAPAEVPPSPSDIYRERTMKELAEIAKRRGIDVPRGMSKAGLMELLAENDGDEFDDAP